ncbi:MAG TPA: hypothetical protein VLG49_01225 [Rhabdochlamydiaceae bacterium]|nr:hypothetical protein [Rhabdochlamydiaceae bacterium]
MKLKSFLLTLFLVIGFYVCSDETRSWQLLDDAGQPIALLKEMLKSLDVENDGSLDSIIKATQKQWLQSGKERWEFDPVFVKDESKTLAYLKAIGCIDSIRPKKKFYDYVCLQGATARRVQARLEFLVEEWNQGLRFKHLVVLTGKRRLDPRIETFPDGIEYETDMIRFLFETSDLPEEIRHIPLEIVDAPAIQLENGKMRRPGRKETIVEWLKGHPKPGTCLMICNQPYIGYQDAVCRTELPPNFVIETVGPEADQDTTFAQYLDNLARWLYTERNLKIDF